MVEKRICSVHPQPGTDGLRLGHGQVWKEAPGELRNNSFKSVVNSKILLNLLLLVTGLFSVPGSVEEVCSCFLNLLLYVIELRQ